MSKQSHIHGAGNVYRMNGTNNSDCTKWTIVIPLGMENGKFKQHRKRFSGTHEEAIAELAKMRQKYIENQASKDLEFADPAQPSVSSDHDSKLTKFAHAFRPRAGSGQAWLIGVEYFDPFGILARQRKRVNGTRADAMNELMEMVQYHNGNVRSMICEPLPMRRFSVFSELDELIERDVDKAEKQYFSRLHSKLQKAVENNPDDTRLRHLLRLCAKCAETPNLA